jgi:hypothetical protein
MSQTFLPPANLDDFTRSASSQTLFQHWHKFINDAVNSAGAQRPAFYNALTPPTPDPPDPTAPLWTGLPRTIKRILPASLAAAARAVDNAIPMGAPDPLEGPHFTSTFFDNATGAVFPGPAYRPQDEYLEWVVRRDTDGTITDIFFTCEGPEYWEHIAQDEKLLVTLYREIVGDNSITIADLTFPTEVRWKNPNTRDDVPQIFKKGQYNPYNRWNIQGAVHLTQPANTLGAEIALAQDATLLYGKPVPVTADPDLICCAGYGGINRMSDPAIGSGVNLQVQQGNRVTLRNPIGLYIRGIQLDAFSLPDDTPFANVQDCFKILRPEPQKVTDMIVRAHFHVPTGITFKGKQLRVGDLKINGEKIDTGGQVADAVTMTLFAEALPGAPVQQRVICRGRPCPDKSHPDFIHAIPFKAKCPQQGITPQAVHINMAAALVTATAPSGHPITHLNRPDSHHAFSRSRGDQL